MYNTILFDLDGTIIEPALGITNSVAYALSKFGITVADRSELYKFIGPPLVPAFIKFYGFDEEQAKLAVKYYRECFQSTGIYENELYTGIKELLKKLKENGKRVALATCKPDVFAHEILKYHGITEYFDFVGGAAWDYSRSTKAQVIEYTLDSCNIKDLSGVVMVGDRENDITGAKQNGIDSIGVLYGYGGLDELRDAGATYIAKNVEELSDLVVR